MAGDVETFQVIRPPGRDAFGDLLPDGTVEFDLPGCRFAPGASREMDVAANQVDTTGTVYAPAGADVLTTDKMRIRGDVYAVVGKPQDWGSSGVVVAVRLVTG